VKNFRAADILEKSLPFYRLGRVVAAVLLLLSLIGAAIVETLVPGFDWSIYLPSLIIAAGVGLIQVGKWVIEGQIAEYRRVGD